MLTRIGPGPEDDTGIVEGSAKLLAGSGNLAFYNPSMVGHTNTYGLDSLSVIRMSQLTIRVRLGAQQAASALRSLCSRLATRLFKDPLRGDPRCRHRGLPPEPFCAFRWLVCALRIAP